MSGDINDSAHGTAAEANLGEMLRHAREARGVSVEDLARRLRLEPRVIVNLENEQFEQLPAPAFIRGYVRSIAKELDVDSAPFIAVFDLRFEDDAPPLSDFQTKPPRQITTESSIIRYTTIGLGIVLVTLVALWWRAHEEPGEVPLATPEPPPSPIVEPASEPLDYTFELVQHPDDPLYRAPEPPAAAAAAPQEPPRDAERAHASPALVITTSAEAWIQITDASGTRLLRELVQPGRRIELDGERPYALVVGNAPAVSLSFDGRNVDLAAISDKGVARFELGGAGSPN